jgi:hypothetical protein
MVHATLFSCPAYDCCLHTCPLAELMYDQSMRPPAHDGPATKVLSWNVAGLRALLKKVGTAAAVGLCVHRLCDLAV